MIKILFINATDWKSEIENRYAPLGIMYLSSALKKSFPPGTFSVRLINKKVKSHLDDFRPDIVAISSVSQNYNIARHYACLAKERGITTLIGGVHISILPESLAPEMDIGCLSEGEETIVELMRVFIDNNKKFSFEKLKEIRGIIFWEKRVQHLTPPRQHQKNLDLIPLPDRSLEGSVAHTYMFSSRGCPYRCVFCSSSRYWNTVRFFSPEYVVVEIESLVKNYYPRMISFYDDFFTADKERLHRIALLVEKKGLAEKVRFTCSCRANSVNADVVEDLKRMGVVSVGLGLESGNNNILKYLKGPTVTVEQSFRAVELFHNMGIRANASFVIGSPLETEAEMIDTYNFIKQSKLSFVDIYVLTPFPGTPVWDYAFSRGLVSNDMDWGRLNVNFEINHNNAVILSELYDRKKIFRIYKKFRMLRFYKNLIALITHPMLIDFPKVLYGEIKEKLTRL